MKKYIGVKILGAEPMTLGAYNLHRGWKTPTNEDPGALGYLVVYPDGYQSWSPAEAFEEAYLEIQGDGTKITPGMVDGFLGTITVQKLDSKTTHVRAENLTGFVQHEVSSCVDPENYDEGIGAEIATEKIKNTIWQCLGFVLQWGTNGLKRDK
jgi:hypothetical protein